MEINGDPPPFWSPPPTTTMSHRRRSPSSPLLPLPVIIILLPILTLLFLFFLVPPFLSFTSHLIRPNSVKKSWDYVNILLVLFAILCGIFARKNDDVSSSDNSSGSGVSKENEEPFLMSQQWFGFSEKKINDLPRGTPATGMGRLRRSSSSYPDLKQETLWETGDDRFRSRFFDDFEIDKYRSHSPVYHRREGRSFVESDVKAIPVDKFVIRSSPKSPTPPSTPPSYPPPVVEKKPVQVFQTIGRKESLKLESENYAEHSKIQTPQPTPPPPPPPRPPPLPPSPARIQSEPKYRESERKRSNTKKEIAMVLASLYNQRKRKKKQKVKNIYDDASSSPPEPPIHSTRPPPSPPPPPPPPPPQPSVFYTLFKKSSKSKKVHSVSAPPPPPPPTPVELPSRFSERKKKIPPPPSPPPPRPGPSRRRTSTNDGRPPLPTRANNLFDKDENVNSGGQSPLIPMPPPPPPFKMPDIKYVFRGDFAKIRSTTSSRCSSPEPEEVNPPSGEGTSDTMKVVMDGGDEVLGQVFCPSPDVNIKADTFIARLRGEWRLEKMNSVREKQTIGSGPNSMTGTGPSSNSRQY